MMNWLYSWCTVIECDEAYTSKTCGKCGKVHAKLGSNKTFKWCDYVADRYLSCTQHSSALFDAKEHRTLLRGEEFFVSSTFLFFCAL
jgi:hypothetical protein